MKAFKFISIVSAVALLLSSCMKMDYAGAQYEGIEIRGMVQDADCNPLNHIRITLDSDIFDTPHVIYTSQKGNFNTLIETDITNLPILIDVTIEDIDGDENGGTFETVTDKISIFENTEQTSSIMISPVYTLNRVEQVRQ